jgi:hypothetical protein
MKTKVKISLVGKVFGRLTVYKQGNDHVTPNGTKIVRY